MIAPPARIEPLKTLRLLSWLFVADWLVRSLLFGAFAIPGVSMLPQLHAGDYLLVAKWPYGWSRHGLFGGAPLFDGRIGAAMPVRGDIVIVRDGDRTLVKRVIGLPGDRIAMRAGTLLLDGRALPRLRVGDLVVPLRPGAPCGGVGRETDGCRYRRYVETLPDGSRHAVLDSAPGPSDGMTERRVPADHLFLLGDNRDESLDSRVPAQDGGIGMIAADRLLGRATLLFWSTDGSARWSSPRSWWRATRWGRIGLGVR